VPVLAPSERTRVEGPGSTSVLVDTSTDLRQQALTYRIARVDAVLITHTHADHVMGLDDIRRFNHVQGGSIPFFASEAAWQILRKVFFYVFDGVPRPGGGIPRIEPRVIDGPFVAGGLHVVPVPLWHGSMPILGFRFGSFAYLTDCNAIPDESWPLLQNLDTLVLDALRDKPHSTHFTIAEALEVVARLAPRRAYFTHMTHDLGHAETNARLPAGVELAYDGLVLDVEVDAVPVDEQTRH
jgi:phosphoribosyl 1,2-cyclic phosphate phosphodiesterase